MNEPFKYDVFLSYGAHDRGEARALAERLQRDGLRVWPSVFASGFPSEFEDFSAEGALHRSDEARQTDLANQTAEAARREQAAGLEQARTLVLLLSRHATAAEWVTFEQHAVRLWRPVAATPPLAPRATLVCLPLDSPVTGGATLWLSEFAGETLCFGSEISRA